MSVPRSSVKALLIAVLPLLAFSCSQRAYVETAVSKKEEKIETAIVETGEKLTLQSGEKAYHPYGTYILGPNEVLSQIEQKLFEDIKNDGKWTVLTEYTVMATVTGKWIEAGKHFSPCVEGRKYRSEIKLSYYKKDDPSKVLVIEQHSDFTY